MACEHRCCTISDNAYHSHRAPPPMCPRCHDQADEEEIAALADIVTSVIDRVAPEIPGLPTDPDVLLELVIDVATTIHRRAQSEHEVQQLSPGRRRTVLAARVGVALAFPKRHPWR